MIAEADVSMKIIGDFGREKHENNLSDCRASCIMYQTGTAGGGNGPTSIVVEVKIIKTRYTDKILK